MYDYFRGQLIEKNVTDAVVEAGGVGYHFSIPLSTFDKLPAPGHEVKLYAHHHVREDAQKLFGFYSTQEREVFRILISISNVGPKIAMSVLGGLTVEDLYRAVQSGDVSRLKSISGIGGKTAERLVIELKGKLPAVSLSAATVAAPASSAAAGKTAKNIDSDQRHQAFLALMALGYVDKQVVAALNRVESTLENNATVPVEQWIKKALQVI